MMGRRVHPCADQEAVVDKSGLLKTLRQGNSMVSSHIPNGLGREEVDSVKGSNIGGLGEGEAGKGDQIYGGRGKWTVGGNHTMDYIDVKL